MKTLRDLGWPIPGLVLKGPGHDYRDCQSIQGFLVKTLCLDREFDRNIDIVVDHSRHISGVYLVELVLGNKTLSRAVIDWERGFMEIGDLLRKNLGVICVIRQVTIEQWCPNAVKGIEAERDAVTDIVTLTVKFKNGHYIQVPEKEFDSDDFKAHCLMVYDLPPL